MTRAGRLALLECQRFAQRLYSEGLPHRVIRRVLEGITPMNRVERALQDTAEYLQVMCDDDAGLRMELEKAIDAGESPEFLYQLGGIKPRAGLALMVSKLNE